jgi:hypothetical protein
MQCRIEKSDSPSKKNAATAGEADPSETEKRIADVIDRVIRVSPA